MEHRPDASLFEIIEDCERRVISDMLEKCGWNQTEAADTLPHSTLHPESEDQAAEYRDQEEGAGERKQLAVSIWQLAFGG